MFTKNFPENLHDKIAKYLQELIKTMIFVQDYTAFLFVIENLG